jgi:hypothetical protein
VIKIISKKEKPSSRNGLSLELSTKNFRACKSKN